METYRIKVGKLSRNNNLTVHHEFCVNSSSDRVEVINHYKSIYSGFDVEISKVEAIDLLIEKNNDGLKNEISKLKDRLENGTKVKVLKSNIYRDYMPKEYIEKYIEIKKQKDFLNDSIKELDDLVKKILKEKHSPFASNVKLEDDFTSSYLDYEIELNGCIIEKTVD